MRENTGLISELARIMQNVAFGHSFVIFTSDAERNYYIQLSRDRDDREIYAEAVANKNQEDPDRLSEDQIAIYEHARDEELNVLDIELG